MRFQDLGKRGVLQNIDPAIIVEEPGWNQRAETPALEQHIQSLAGSIRALGVLEPLTAYMKGDAVVLVNGHCRLAAVRMLLDAGEEIKTVPVRVEPHTANDADRVLSMVTRNSGKPLEPMEVAAVFKRLVAFGWDAADIATKTGYSENRVGELLRLNAAPEEVKGMIARGEVAATTAAKVLRKAGAKDGTAILTTAVATAKANGKAKASGRHLPQPVSEQATLAVTDEAERSILGEGWNRFLNDHGDQFTDRQLLAFKASFMGLPREDKG
jgi:ParB-like chromosome segregation protein Spo0J